MPREKAMPFLLTLCATWLIHSSVDLFFVTLQKSCENLFGSLKRCIQKSIPALSGLSVRCNGSTQVVVSCGCPTEIEMKTLCAIRVCRSHTLHGTNLLNGLHRLLTTTCVRACVQQQQTCQCS